MLTPVDPWTLTTLEQITDLLDTPNPQASCVRRAFALAYAERERLSKAELDRLQAEQAATRRTSNLLDNRSVCDEDLETVSLGSDLPGVFGGLPNASDSALLTANGGGV